MYKSEKDRIVALYRELGTYKKVREATGHSTTTIWECVNEAGEGVGKGGNQKAQIKVTDAQLVSAIRDGLSRKEIAEKFGVHPEGLPRRFKKIGMRPTKRATPTVKAKSIGWHYVATHNERVQAKQDGFKYIATKARKIKLRCLYCGEELERCRETVYRNKIVCRNCIEKEKTQTGRAEMVRFLYALIESKVPKKCAECGETFFSQYRNARYCSDRCRSRKKKKRKGNYRRRCEKYGVFYDNTITRAAVIKKYDGICQICGIKCDETDRGWGTTGAKFPTVDHIIPLAKGGAHTWDNVQCACAMCNSKKRDLITA